MYSLQGFKSIFLFGMGKSDRNEGVAGMRQVGGVRIRAWRTTQK